MFYEHYDQVPRALWRWRYFIPRELASKGDGSLLIDEDALDRLEYARRLLGQPLVILSAYRDPLHNAKVGGAPLSMHKEGKAFDIRLTGLDKWQLLIACQKAGFTGFGFYSTFLHVDTGKPRTWGKIWNS
jgi:zinc D-Ala-D-Ala carboxypeptidase